MLNVIGGQDEVVADWAGRSVGEVFVRPFSAFGITEEDGLLRGAAIFNDYYQGGNIELTYIGPRTVTRRVIRALATYAFKDNVVSRVTCKTHRKNIVARKLLPRLGFKLEGTQKRYYGTERGDDALVFVLDKSNASRWLTGA